LASFLHTKISRNVSINTYEDRWTHQIRRGYTDNEKERVQNSDIMMMEDLNQKP
jgi:hypothetical protein